MSIDTGLTASAAQQYAVAYKAHYTTKDLRLALDLYKGIIALHPDAQETSYSRTQIQNIVNAVVPKRELMDAQVSLALAHLGPVDGEDPEPAPVMQTSGEHD